MKQKKPAATPAANTTKHEVPKLSNTRREDWIDEVTLMEMFYVSETTVRNHRKQGILHCSTLGVKKWFYLPHILRYMEENYK